MIDRMGRNITYLRLSITDRCNLRCRYCMPHGTERLGHADILRYEEYLFLVGLLARLGISHVRVTGGEPLVRKDVVSFIKELKQLPGIEKVSITTTPGGRHSCEGKCCFAGGYKGRSAAPCRPCGGGHPGAFY